MDRNIFFRMVRSICYLILVLETPEVLEVRVWFGDLLCRLGLRSQISDPISASCLQPSPEKAGELAGSQRSSVGGGCAVPVESQKT